MVHIDDALNNLIPGVSPHTKPCCEDPGLTSNTLKPGVLLIVAFDDANFVPPVPKKQVAPAVSRIQIFKKPLNDL